MNLLTYCRLVFEITVPTPFVFMLRPRSGAHQWVCSDKYTLSPLVYVSEFTDSYGNLCQRLVAPAGEFSITTNAEIISSGGVDREPGGHFVEVQNLPDSVLIYLLPSRYCEAEYFGNLATEITAGLLWGYDQVAAIENWIRTNIRYEFSGNPEPIAASEVNTRQSGVCRDLAHLGIALCRSLSIPARMVVGFLHGLEPMDMHAWFEAYVAGRWYLFDPTQTGVRDGYVVLGYGRDAADVAVYNQFGPPAYPLEQTVAVVSKPPL
jgi:transglutaminase-like putative cysteine protease